MNKKKNKSKKLNDEIFEIDLRQFLINSEIFTDKILEIVSKNCGWMAGDLAVFTMKEEKDYCEMILKEEFENDEDIDEIYHAVLEAFPNLSLSDIQDEIKNAIHDLLNIAIKTITQLKKKTSVIELDKIIFYQEYLDELSKIDKIFDIKLDQE